MENPTPKKVILALSSFILLGFVIGVFVVRGDLSRPFPLNSNTSDEATADESTTNESLALLALQSKDTDTDGLSDYDELYTYDTSPYLADSDSDGVSDADEIVAGDDPNCPKGQECKLTVTQTTPLDESNQNIEDVNAIISEFENVDVAQLRQTLLNSGAPQETVDQFSDEDLRQMYQEALTETSGLNLLNTNTGQQTATTNTNTQPATTTNTNTNTSGGTTITTNELQSLTADEIRSLLITSGADETTINGVDDTTLRNIFNQALIESGLVSE